MSEQISAGKLFVELLVKDAQYGPALRKAMAELDAFRSKAESSATAAAAKVKPLATAFNNVTEAEKRHAAAVIASNAAEQARAQALGVTLAQLRQVDAALKAEKASAAGASVSVGQAAGAAQNLRFQMFDVVQQLSAGQNPLMILNQQGFQIAQALQSGGSAAATFKAALGPLAPILSGIASVAGPLALVLAALATVYSELTLAEQEHYEATQGVIDSQLRAAKAIKATEDQIKAANKAWNDYNSDLMDAEVREAVLSGALTEDEAAALRAQQQAVSRYAPEIERLGKEWASATTELAAYEAMYASGKFEKMREAEPKIRELTPIVAKLSTELDQKKTEASELAARLGQLTIKEGEADERGKTASKAMKDAAAAAKAYAEALERIQSIGGAAGNKATLARFESMGGDNSAERAFFKSQEEARQRAEASAEKARKALDDGLAEAAVIGGAVGETMAIELRVAYADTERLLLDEMMASLDEAERKAYDAQKSAAEKRLEADAAEVSIRVNTQQEYADTVSEIERRLLEVFSERARVQTDYARLSADEQLAIEQKLTAEMDALRAQSADAQIDRNKRVAQSYKATTSDIMSQMQSVLSELYDASEGSIREIDDALEADADARKKRDEGVTLSAEEQQEILTTVEKRELEKRRTQQQEAALAAFRAQQALSAVMIAMNTATAIMKAVADLGPIAGAIAGVALGALGAVQMGIVMSEEPPEFHVGGVVSESDRGRSPGRSTTRAVTTELEVGEGVLVGRAVSALGGPEAIDRLNFDPYGAIASLSSRIGSVPGLGPTRFSSRSMSVDGAPPAAGQAAARPPDRPIVVVSKIGERTFDTILASGIQGGRTPQVKRSMRRMIGSTVGLEG